MGEAKNEVSVTRQWFVCKPGEGASEKLKIIRLVEGLVLSRLRSGLSAHLGSLSFKGQGTFATSR